MVTVAFWEGATPKIETSVEMIIHTWNLFVLYFLGFNPPKEGLFQSKQGSFKGSRLQVYIYIYICFLFHVFFGFQGLIQDESCLGGEDSTTKGSFYIFQYLFHDGVLSTLQTLPLVLCHMHESALVMSQRLRVKPFGIFLGSSSLGGFIFFQMLPWFVLGRTEQSSIPIYLNLADFERKV